MILKTIGIIFFIVSIYFIYLEIKKMKRKKEKRLSYGNGQYIGQMDCQNDYFSITEISASKCLIIIADGTSSRNNIRTGVIMANNTIKNLYLEKIEQSRFDEVLKEGFVKVEENNKKYVFENRIAVSVLCVEINNNVLSYGNIGSCVLLVYRNKEIVNISDEENVKEKYGSFKVKGKDKIILLSKGAFLSITELELISELESKKETNEKAIAIINLIRNKGYKHQENATVVLVEID